MANEGRTPLLKNSRWLLLKPEENLKAEQRFRLRDLLRYNLRTVRAHEGFSGTCPEVESDVLLKPALDCPQIY